MVSLENIFNTYQRLAGDPLSYQEGLELDKLLRAATNDEMNAAEIESAFPINESVGLSDEELVCVREHSKDLGGANVIPNNRGLLESLQRRIAIRHSTC